jgi:uncharacterized membrane protein AbrB (regulator of aidB expression)
MTVAGLTDLGERSPDPLAEAVVERGATGDQSELIEWWHGDEQKGDTREPLSFEEVEQRRMLTLAFIGIAVVFCASLGWIIGPAMLDGPIESLTGTPVEEPSDLRGLGTFVGLIAGMFIGASGGWVIWSTR